MFLQLFYLDGVSIKIKSEVFRSIPTLPSWSDKDLRAPQRKETSENLFGEGWIRCVDETTTQTEEIDRNADEERKKVSKYIDYWKLKFFDLQYFVESINQFC